MSLWLFLGADSPGFQRVHSSLSSVFESHSEYNFVLARNVDDVQRLISNGLLTDIDNSFVLLAIPQEIKAEVLSKCGKSNGEFMLVDTIGPITNALAETEVSADSLVASAARIDELLSLPTSVATTQVGLVAFCEVVGVDAEAIDFTAGENEQERFDRQVAEVVLEFYRSSGGSLVGEVAKLWKRFRDREQELVSKVAELDASLTHRGFMLAQKREEIVSLKSSLDGSSSTAQEKELLVLQVEQLESELDAAYLQVEEAKARSGSIAALSSENRGLVEQVRQIRLQFEETEEQNKKLKLLASEVRDRLAVTESELGALQDKYAPIKTYCDEMEAQLTHYERQLDSLKSSNETLSERLTISEAKNVDLIASAEAEATAEATSEENAELKAMNEVFQSQTEIFRAEVKTLLKEKEMVNGMSSLTRIEDMFSKTKITGLAVLGSYSDDGYQDLKFTCAGLELGDQRFFKKLSFKLVLKGGKPGLEFRPDEANSEHLEWVDFCNDEYGYYLPCFPSDSSEADEQQVRVSESLSSSDRMLILGVASTLAQALQSADLDVRIDLDSRDLRKWRLAALELQDRLKFESHWLSHENVYLEEEYSEAGYQHLWLSVDHLLHGRRYFKKFDYKLAVPAGRDEQLGLAFSLEFRQLLTGDAPLFAWPSDTSDESGSYLRVDVVVSDNLAQINFDGEVSFEDEALIEALIQNSRYFIMRLADEGVQLGRSTEEWLGLLGSYNEVKWPDAEAHPGFTEVSESPESATKENESVDFSSAQRVGQDSVANFELQEVLEMDGYSHIAFVAPHQDRGKVLVKYQLKYVGDELDGWVEFRSDDAEQFGLPFDHVESGSEDEYGRVITLRYQHLHESEHTDRLCESASDNDVDLLNQVKQQAADLGQFVDDQTRDLWVAKFW